MPDAASHFSYCFGAVKPGDSNHSLGVRFNTEQAAAVRAKISKHSATTEALLRLMLHGGYVYLDQQNCKVLQVNLCSTEQLNNDGSEEHTTTVQFAGPVHVPQTLKRFITQQARWVPTAFGHIQEGGSMSFTWLHPGEMQFAPFGGFLYRMGPNVENLLFPVSVHS